MKKIKYFYNTHTLRYEKLVTPLRVKLLRIFGFLASALVTSVIISYFAFQFVGSPAEKILRAQNERLSDSYQELNARVKTIQEQMSELEKRDNEVYRTIFEAKPIPDSARSKAIEQEQEMAKVESMRGNLLVNSIYTSVQNLNARIAAQKNSYKELTGLLNNKEKL